MNTFLAACLLHRPKLLLLDEPTAGVDPKARRDFWEEIHRLSATGMTVLVSTHYMDEAERCHRLAYIAEGTLLACGTATEIVASQKLHTWEISGAGLQEWIEPLRHLPGVDLVASFGAMVHVSGSEESRLKNSLETLLRATSLNMVPVPSSLEDVFIYMMQRDLGGRS